MKQKTILILDDDDNFANRIKKQLDAITSIKKRGFNTVVGLKDEFIESVAELERRARAGKKHPPIKYSATIFDTADILIVDYDVAKLNEDGPLLTGERISYLARCYSSCGLIVALNQFGSNSFDLRLAGHPESYADLNLGDRQIGNRGLWEDVSDGKLRPWHWPILPDAWERFVKRVNSIQNMSDRIFPSLGIPDVLIKTFPASVLAWIAPDLALEEIPNATFEGFVSKSKAGLKGKNTTEPKYEKRIAAARIGKWVERLLMPGQNILVDAPHLVARFPSLLKGPITDTTLAIVCHVSDRALVAIHAEKINDARFGKTEWISRPVWWWEKIRLNEQLAEIAKPWEKEEIKFGFCEDTSDFRPKSKCTEFVADLPTPFTRRHVAKISGVAYTPALQLSL